MVKFCKHCGMSSAQTKFDMWRGEPRGLQCTTCRNGINRYGLNRKEQIKLLESQDGKCKLCEQSVELFQNRKGGFVDHCHTTGKARGVLCLKCNNMLGFIEDKTWPVEKFLANLEDYLQGS